MGAEQQPGQINRVGRPVFQQFKDGLPGNNGVLGSRSGERRGSGQPFSVDRPIDLVGNIRALVQQERASHRGEFNPAWWLRSEMKSLFELAGVKHAPQDMQQSIVDLRIAWQLVAYQQLEAYRDSVYSDIQTFGSGRRSIKLDPLGVTLLDAMAEATGIKHTPGQDTFDISLFSGIEAMARIRRGQVPEGHKYPVPTSEEVKNAITPKKTT